MEHVGGLDPNVFLGPVAKYPLDRGTDVAGGDVWPSYQNHVGGVLDQGAPEFFRPLTARLRAYGKILLCLLRAAYHCAPSMFWNQRLCQHYSRVQGYGLQRIGHLANERVAT